MIVPLIITIHSPQGGSGKSTLALNLAIQFAKQGKKTILMDMAGYGSLPSMCKVPIRGCGMSSLITILEQNDELPSYEHFVDYYREAIVAYKDCSQLDLLLSASPLKMENLSSAFTEYLIEITIKRCYEVIVVDTSSELCERNIACIERANVILIPTLQDVSSGWKIILFNEILTSLRITKEHVFLIANRVSKYSGFNNIELQDEIGLKLLCEIPEMMKKVQRHINSGTPMNLIGNRKLTSIFEKLAKKIVIQVA